MTRKTTNKALPVKKGQKRTKKVPTGLQLAKLQKARAKNRVRVKPNINHLSETHRVLLYAKFKKTAFPWSDWYNFHSDFKMRRGGIERFIRLVIFGYLDHRLINGEDYFQITLDGEHKLIEVAEKDQLKRTRAAKRSAKRGFETKMTNLMNDDY